jgi:hypothetical protein
VGKDVNLGEKGNKSVGWISWLRVGFNGGILWKPSDPPVNSLCRRTYVKQFIYKFNNVTA